ncbi:alpha/beta fold hydrolase [Devosia lacusdianchii]|uniref:alpha/beta fold hydrolase n=1 Tax=Devosia lacusdianchii TaxID=2917991 RepID=UPI001F0709A7|nr:alpha/beta hydrolase [Devosia sp. JXJ CY 41]
MSTTRSHDGTPIGYTAIGSGPAIVMVMGATQFRGIDPSAVALGRILSDRFTFVIYDRRGRGESGDTQPYAVAREIEDIAAVIEAVGGEASLYGSSSGSVLAIEAAAAGLPITNLVLYEPPFRVDPDDPLRTPADYLTTLEGHIARGDRGAAATHFMHYVGMPADHIEGMKQSEFWPVLEAIAPTLAYDARVMTDAYRDGQFPARWQRVTQPTLVVTGDQTFPFIPASVAAVTASLPRARSITLAGQGHGPSPDAIAPVLAEFMGSD